METETNPTPEPTDTPAPPAPQPRTHVQLLEQQRAASEERLAALQKEQDLANVRLPVNVDDLPTVIPPQAYKALSQKLSAIELEALQRAVAIKAQKEDIARLEAERAQKQAETKDFIASVFAEHGVGTATPEAARATLREKIVEGITGIRVEDRQADPNVLVLRAPHAAMSPQERSDLDKANAARAIRWQSAREQTGQPHGEVIYPDGTPFLETDKPKGAA